MRGAGKLVVDGFLVAAQRVLTRGPNTGPKRVTSLLEPVHVHRVGSARRPVEQPGMGASVPGIGKVDHPGQLFRTVLVDADVKSHLPGRSFTRLTACSTWMTRFLSWMSRRRNPLASLERGPHQTHTISATR